MFFYVYAIVYFIQKESPITDHIRFTFYKTLERFDYVKFDLLNEGTEIVEDQIVTKYTTITYTLPELLRHAIECVFCLTFYLTLVIGLVLGYGLESFILSLVFAMIADYVNSFFKTH